MNGARTKKTQTGSEKRRCGQSMMLTREMVFFLKLHGLTTPIGNGFVKGRVMTPWGLSGDASSRA